MADTRRVSKILAFATWCACISAGFAMATVIYPPRPYVLPSTILAVVSGAVAAVSYLRALVLWRRGR